jgi:SAM-dependent methyltransferase
MIEHEVRGRETPNCVLCGSAGGIIHADMRDRLYSVPGVWRIRRCVNPACGFAWLDPAPLESEQPRLYESYFTHADEPGARPAIPAMRLMLRRAFNILLRAISLFGERRRASVMYLDGRAPGSLLEVGCGDGAKLAMLRSRGWGVTGQDLDAKAAQHACEKYGLDVRTTTVEALAQSGETIDAIIANHVIEHVSDPAAFLRHCSDMLKPGGRLVIMTPNLDSHGHRVFGRNWMGLDPPRHLFLFSPVSLARLCHTAGIGSAAVLSTCANAQLFAFGSLDIRKHGRHTVGSIPTLAAELSAMRLQLQAYGDFRKDPASGEECVLIYDK